MKTPLIFATLVLSASALAQVPSTTSPSTGTTGNSSSSSSGLSNGTSSSGAQTFESLDTNSDGRISMSEAQADPSLASKFSTLDKQNKGYITRQEYQSYMRENNNGTSSSGTSSSGR